MASNQLSFASAAVNNEPLNDVSTSIVTLSADYPNNLNVENKSVVRSVNWDICERRKLLFMFGKPRVYLLMRVVVADVSEPYVFRTDF